MKEKEYSKKFELFAHGFAKKLGYDSVPWFKITEIILGIYVVITVLSMFFRPDFVNVSLEKI